jgi:hypothetical protein
MLVITLPSLAGVGAAESVLAAARKGATADREGAIVGHQGVTDDN